MMQHMDTWPVNLKGRASQIAGIVVAFLQRIGLRPLFVAWLRSFKSHPPPLISTLKIFSIMKNH
jgi:hypothetical protein